MIDDGAILKQAAIVLACLFAVAGALTLASCGTSWGRNMGVATASWAVICTVFLLVPFAGVVPFAVLMAAIAILAVREFYALTGVCRSLRLATASVFVVAMAAALVAGDVTLFHRLPLIAVVVMFLAHALRFSFEGDHA